MSEDDLTDSTPKKSTKPKGRKWTDLNAPTFRKKHPILGVRRLAKAGVEDPKIKITTKTGRRMTYRYKRLPPSERTGVKFQAIIVHFETRAKLQELKKFYGKPMAAIVREQIDALWEKATQEAEVLARIEENRRKREEEASNTDTPKRKYNV